MPFLRRVLAMTCLVLPQVGMAQAAVSSKTPDPVRAPSGNLAVSQAQAVSWRADMAHVVFFRLANDPSDWALRVHVANGYHASLLPGTYAELCMPAGDQALQLRPVRAASVASEVGKLTLIAGQSRYVRVWQEAGQPVRWQEVPREQALQEAGDVLPAGALTRVPKAMACRRPA